MNTIYQIKDFITSGYAIQWYIAIALTLLIAMAIKGAVYIKKNKPIRIRYSFKFGILSCVLFMLIIWLLIPTPILTYPRLPLFDPVEVSAEKPLVVRFDRPINKSVSYEINPPIEGMWKITHTFPGLIASNTIVFTPSVALQTGTEYSVSVKNFSALDPNSNILFVFTTTGEKQEAAQKDEAKKLVVEQTSSEAPLISREQIEIKPTSAPASTAEFKIPVPLIKQKHMFGCFSAAARMALSYRGVADMGELEFIDMVGHDNTERNFVTNTWGNPNQATVGTFDGSGPGGYGAHWDPVVRVMNQYRPTEVRHGWNVPELLAEVKNGNPILVWWVNGVWPAKDVSWNLPDGSKVYTVNGMHVEVVVGWKGDINNPTTIYTNDPWRGYRAYTRGTFEQLWRWFDNTGVIVR